MSLFPSRRAAAPQGPRPGSGLELFMTHLAEIAPRGGKRITPESRLVEDLDFDSLAFTRLALLLYEHYHLDGIALSTQRSHPETVATFFERYVEGPRAPRR